MANRIARLEPLSSDLVCTARSADWDTNEAVCRHRFYVTSDQPREEAKNALSGRGNALLRSGQVATKDLTEFYAANLSHLDLSDMSCIASPLLGFLLFRFPRKITKITLPNDIRAANAVLATLWNARRGMTSDERTATPVEVTGRLALVRILDRLYASAVESGVVLVNDPAAGDLTVNEMNQLFARALEVQ